MQYGKLVLFTAGFVLFAAAGLSQGLDTSPYDNVDLLNGSELPEEKSDEEDLRNEIKQKVEERKEELDNQKNREKSSEGLLSSFIGSLF